MFRMDILFVKELGYKVVLLLWDKVTDLTSKRDPL